MKMTQDLAELLERLYNLKGENNVIISQIKGDIQRVEDNIAEETSKQSNNELSKVEMESQLSIFMTQKEAFCSTFTGIGNDTFSALNEIGINLDITNMLDTINEKAPLYCDELNEKIDKAGRAIEDAKHARETLSNELNNLNERLESAKEDRNDLIGLLEQSLSANAAERESLTIKDAKDIIERFGVFNSREVSALAKVILFPEDGLIEFDETYDDREHPDFSKPQEEVEETKEEKDNDSEIVIVPPVVEEKTEEPQEEVEVVQEPVKEDNSEVNLEAYLNEEPENEDLTSQTYQNLNSVIDDEPTQILDITSLNRSEEQENTEEEFQDITNEEAKLPEFNLQEEPIVLSSEVKEENPTESELEEETAIDEEPKEEEPEVTVVAEEPKEEDPYKELKSNLENIGLNLEYVEDNKELLEELSNCDIKHVEENYEILRSINVDDKVIYEVRNNHSYLVDKELNKKVTLLRAKGINEHKLKELIETEDSGLEVEYSVLEERIKTIEETNDKLSDENVHLIALDVSKYNDNIKILVDNGFEIDEKDLRNYQAVLYKSDNVKEDVEVLKNYLLSIQRKNGKYALGTFFKNSKELLFDIDDLVEAKLEDLFETPEVLSNRVDALIARTRYASANNESIFEDEEEGIINKNIVDGLKFYRTYHQDVNEYMPRDRKEVNASIATLLDGSKEMVEVLDNYYDSTTLFKDIELTDQEKEMLNSLKEIFNNKLNVVAYGEYTYLVNDVPVSKNKVERNLAVLVKGRDTVEGKEKELILSAVLYNLRQTEDVLKQIIDAYGSESTKDGGEA